MVSAAREAGVRQSAGGAAVLALLSSHKHACGLNSRGLANDVETKRLLACILDYLAARGWSRGHGSQESEETEASHETSG